jgi:hypothetical protein
VTGLERRLVCAAIILLGISAVGRAARAQAAAPPDERRRFEIGVRVGVAFPHGELDGQSGALGSEVSNVLPALGIDAGYRLTRTLTLGARFQYGNADPTDLSGLCGPFGRWCWGSVTSLAVRGTFRFPISGPVVPWLAVGAGYEWFDITLWTNIVGLMGSTSQTLRGPELGFIEVGVDYRVAPIFRLGPFAGLTIGRYDHAAYRSDQNGMSTSSDLSLTSTALHEWLGIGVRGELDL